MISRDSVGVIAGLSLLLSGWPLEAQIWTSLGANAHRGPAGPAYSGRVASIGIDPGDINHWLIGVGNGGVWETHDAGANFAPLSDAWPTMSIGAVAFAPSKPAIIYVGTGEPDPGAGGGFGQTGLGIMKSTDGGKTWSLLAASSFARATVKRIRINPTNPNIVLAGTSRGGFGRDSQEGAPSPPPFGILQSSDGGSTWTRTLNGQATALEVDPTNFNNQYAAIGDQRGPNGRDNDSADSVPNGVYRSTDGGHTWSPVAGPWGASSKTRATAGRIELAIAPSNPSLLYASIQVPPNGGSSATGLLGLYRTDNAGAPTPTWIQIATDPTGTGGYCGPGKCGYAHVISVNPSDQDTLFAFGGENGDGGWRCSRCGASPVWTNVAGAPFHSDHHSMAWAGSRLIDGNDGGVWSTTDLGITWRNHNANVSTLMFFGGSLHPANSGVVLGGLRDNGVVTRTGNDLWTFTALPETVTGAPELGEAEVAVSASHPDTNWMASWIFGVIGRTTDGGRSWTGAGAGIDNTGVAFVAPVRECPGNEDIFLTGSNRMWRTDNFFSSAAPSWAPNGPASAAPLPNSLGYPGTILEIEFIASDTTCDSYAYGNRGGQVWLTRDGGKTWNDLDPGKNLPSRPVNGLAFDPTNPNIVYAALSSFDDATSGKPGHVFKTTNALSASQSWTNVSPPLNEPFNVIRVDPANPRLIYAGSDTGLWRSTDAAATWVHDSPQSGLPNAPIYDIKINPVTGRTVVFTYGRGAFARGPELTAGSALNAATYYPGGLVPGSWATLSGTNLSGVSRTWTDVDFAALGGNLPVNLSGVQVTVNGVPAAAYYISPTQINFQVPEVATGTVMVQVIRDGVPSNTVQAPVLSSSPGIFPVIVNGKNYPAGVFLDGEITGDPASGSIFRKARPGDVIQLFATGLAPSPAGTLVSFRALSGVTVTVGSVTIPADAAGLVAAGEFQINFTIPQQFASMPEGGYPITIQVNGVSSPMNINSNPPAPLVLPVQH
jgi:uncharacterized protein (TIGR03437 family)